MKADVFYGRVSGRFLFKCLQKAGFFRLLSLFLQMGISRHLIPVYISRYGIDMEPFADQHYRSFAAFFARKRKSLDYKTEPNVLVSPCDGLLSIYPLEEDLTIFMKGSEYSLNDLIPDKDAVKVFQEGLGLVFRLEASDYHHFCYFDEGMLIETNYVPGELHSVQPIALRTMPVFRLNRRWWSILETEHFGTAAQIEIGAMLVGGVSFFPTDGAFRRGDDMGCFEIAGSTIILLLESKVRDKLFLNERFLPAIEGKKEVRIRMGSTIGILRDEK